MENLEKLDKAVGQLEQQSRDLGEFLRVYELVTSLKSDIELSRETIVKNNASFNELSAKIQNELAEHSESLSDLEKRLLEKVRELYDDNKKYQKELDDTINSKLEKNKSDMEVTVRSEGTQIQRAFETSLKSNFGEMRQELDGKFEEYSKKIQRNTIILTVIIFIQFLTGLLIYLY